MYLLKWIENLLDVNYQSLLEDYISNQHPQSVAEIEYLTKEYERRHLSSWNY